MAAGLAALAAADPDRHILSSHRPDGTTTSFTRAEFNDRVNRAIHVLRADGLRPGDAAAILAQNSTDYITALTSAALMDVSQVAVNWHLNDEEIEYILASSGAKAVICDPSSAAAARRAAEAAGIDVVIELGEAFERRLAAACSDEPPTTAAASAVYYTSGTTGKPKATRMAQMKTGLSVEQLQQSILDAGYGPDCIHLAMGPLYHGGPLMQAVRAIMIGGQLHVMEQFDPALVLRLIERYGVTHTLGVPTHFVRLLRLDASEREKHDLSSLQEVFHIAAMMPPAVKRQMIEWWGPVLTDAYGCSELGVITAVSSQEWLERPGSVGRAIPSFTLHIRDEDGNELPRGEVGTIWIESHTDADIVYLNDPEKTARCHRSPTEFTLFDVGYLDDDDYLYLVDRRVDMIISGGVNIYPAEVESTLITHPLVDDVGVFAIPDDEWGHSVKGAVQLRPGTPATGETEAEILQWAREHLAHFKVPKSLDFHEQLPRYTNGKLHRRRLRDPYWEGHNSVGEPQEMSA